MKIRITKEGIRISNDGKQRAQSCEANIWISKNAACGNFHTDIEAYGDNEAVAKRNFIEQVDLLILELNKLKGEAKNYKNE